MLKGKRVILRELRKSDVAFFLKWFNDSDVTRYLNAYLPMTEGAEEKWIADRMKAEGPFFVIDAVGISGGKTPIGTCMLAGKADKDMVLSFAIMIGNINYWNDGYGTEAARLLFDYGFNTLNLHKIESCAIAFNKRSLGIHEKLGFVEEGRKRECVYADGAYHDMVMFGLLKREWEKK